MQNTLKLDAINISQTTYCPVSEDHSLYAIVEPLLIPEILAWLYEDRPSTIEFQSLFSEDLYQNHKGEGPLLIKVTDENALLSRLACHFERHPSGTFIESKLSFSELLDWCLHRLTSKNSGNLALFRFYEPRMLLPLLASFKPAERQTFTQGTTKITWFHRRWLQHETKAAPMAPNALQFIHNFSPEHLAEMQDIQQKWKEMAGEFS
ncbi:hypothetical protein CW749_01945 [Vibrio sp. vnigr-6D03]|uniref:DUF4123 domain-containing protein n=1 Tax=Vibrio sp. vnigr-6D03 TaxID=2058088 RepID=UPI000C327224|nr:DUF4123 domain-containing protein [Vibrio sp. vnigr-6D03]PKF81425.1 hypothetical protein CW749_01945 [Vibrio sp. vnigr-6D03]